MKKIILGNNEAYITDYNIKQIVIDYLYSKLDLSKFRYLILTNTQTLKFLQDNEHYISPNYKGFNYLLIFLKIENSNYCVLIDRRKLSYHKQQLDMKTIQIIQIHIDISDIIYRGTIFDGKLIQKNSEYIFLIQDCLYLMGNKLLEMDMQKKLLYLNDIINNNISKTTDSVNKKNIYCKNFLIKLNKLYKYNDLENLVNKILPELCISTNGIIFFPKLSGVNILYIDKKVNKNDNVKINNNHNVEETTFNIINNYIDFLKNRSYSYESNSKTKVLWLSKTNIIDVYYISENEDSEKIGIACIPNLKISQMCDKLIVDKPRKFNCIYYNRFKKWIPLEIIN